jgi:hypothetical protein
MIILSQSGCGSDSPGDKVMKEEIAIYNDTAAIEEQSAATDETEMRKRTDEFMRRMGEFERKRNELNLSDEERRKLHEKYKDERAKAVKRLQDLQKKNFEAMLEKLKSTH